LVAGLAILLLAILAAQSWADEADTAAAGAFDAEGNQTTTGQMLLTVTDEDGRPLAGAEIGTTIATRDPGDVWGRNYETDGEGHARIALPSTVKGARLWISKAGHVSLFRAWWGAARPDGEPVPSEATLVLRKGATIGGLVVDEDGYPIPGAKILLRLQGEPRETNERETLGNDERVVADAKGRWRTDRAPPDNEETFCVAATHPEFVSLTSQYNLPRAPYLLTQELRDQTARIVMQVGVRVTGKVTDPEGKPVAGALVVFGDKPYFQHFPRQEVLTDEHGVYRLPPLPEGQMRITVVAKGWMPRTELVNLEQNQPPLDFTLQTGKTLRVRVIDAKGWRGTEALYNYIHPNVIESQIPGQTDQNGIFEWTWAPDDAVTWRIGKSGVGEVRNVPLTADDTGEFEVQL
jgi:uncharacterized GH25 family protein